MHCDEMFADSYQQFYSTDPSVVLSATKKALNLLKASKDNRPRTIKGNGAQHIIHVVNLKSNKELKLQSVRLLAEAALHDMTEVRTFRSNAFYRVSKWFVLPTDLV